MEKTGRPPAVPARPASSQRARTPAAARCIVCPPSRSSSPFSRTFRPSTKDPAFRRPKVDDSPGQRPPSAGSVRRAVARVGATRPQSAQPVLETAKPVWSLGDVSTRKWEELGPLAGSGPRSLHTKRTPAEQEHTTMFSYRAALGGFGEKPNAQTSDDLSIVSDDESDAGSIFSEEEGKRRARAQRCSWLTAQLPGYEDAGNLREKAHLQRMVTSADRLFPVRNSLKTLGIEKLNAIVYRRPDPSGLMSTLSADIYTGLWSCCRKTNASAPGCVLGTHSDTTFLCTRCGVTFDNSTATPAQRECFYHPGAINRSKAGGVWWTCCGAVGFKNSMLHSEGGDLHGAQDWRWGCKRDAEHVALSTFDPNTDRRKYVHCTFQAIVEHEAVGPQPEPADLYTDKAWLSPGRTSCNRIASITCVAQPLLPVVLGIQLQWEVVENQEYHDGDRYVGNPGVVSNRDHLRKVREEKLTFAPDEYMVRLDVEYNERNIQTLTVVTSSGREHTFFDKWIIDNNEKTLRDMQSVEDVEPTIEELSAPDGHRIVGLRYGIGDSLRCLGIITQPLLGFDAKKGEVTTNVTRCTLCAGFYMPLDDAGNGADTNGAKEKVISSTHTANTARKGARRGEGQNFLGDACRYHSGWWTPQRRVRLADNSTNRKCGALCLAINCGKPCRKFQHRSHVMAHSCGDNRCAEICDMEGCTRRCSVLDHFHSINDPMAIHTCGGTHPCKVLCVCGQKCKFVAAKGEAVHTWHWCGSDEGCNKRCSVPKCENRCKHPNHHHHLEEDCVHHCGGEHPCLETCSAEGCNEKCMHDRERPHKHACQNPLHLGCRSVCSVEGCTEICADPDHFHADYSDDHICDKPHPCKHLCSAPGCKSFCSVSREKAHTRHECDGWHRLSCVEICAIPGCNRPCVNTDHFHGCDLIEVDGQSQPRKPHLCGGKHICGKKCTAVGCHASCVIDKAVVGHQCQCEGHSGCRVPCWFSGQPQRCSNFCASSDHFHDVGAGGRHFCSNEHVCNEPCDVEEPCLWEGGQKRRQKKTCTKMIPAGQTKHEGPHDCGGKHARPVDFSQAGKSLEEQVAEDVAQLADKLGVSNEEVMKKGLQRCAERCDKFGCRSRCRFKANEADHPKVNGEVIHVCHELMCLDICPYPKCKGVCTRDHDHSLRDEASKCGCCVSHQNFDPATQCIPVPRSAAVSGEERGGSATVRAEKMMADMKLASEVKELRSQEGGLRRLKTKRPAAETGVAGGGSRNEEAAKPFYHGYGVNVEKYGRHFQMYSGMAPLERSGAASTTGVPGAAAIRPLNRSGYSPGKASLSRASHAALAGGSWTRRESSDEEDFMKRPG